MHKGVALAPSVNTFLTPRIVCGTGIAFPDVPVTQKWYPVVGIDTACNLQVNFGTKIPFLFDLLAFEQRVWSALVVSPVSCCSTLCREASLCCSLVVCGA